MKQLFDYIPVIVFFSLYFLGGKDIMLATWGILIATTFQVTVGWLIWRKVETIFCFGLWAMKNGCCGWMWTSLIMPMISSIRSSKRAAALSIQIAFWTMEVQVSTVMLGVVRTLFS